MAGRAAWSSTCAPARGAIALAVATRCPGAGARRGADPAALAWAARELRTASGVDLRLGDMADALPRPRRTVDLVVTNPPYIPVGASIRDPEVADHDPALALWSGDDGLDAMRVVERVAAPAAARPAGWSSSSTPTSRAVGRPRSSPRAGGWATSPTTRT